MTTSTATIAGLIARAVPLLREADSDDPRLEAEVLAMHVTGMTKALLYSSWGEAVNPAYFEGLLARRLKGEPLAYVVGHREFYGRDFKVDPRVLIPRPETELLVEAALGWVSANVGQAPPPATGMGAQGGPPTHVADVGTGSGAIAISLAAERTDLTMYGLDKSRDALDVARTNAEVRGATIIFLEGDLLEPLPEPVDLIVANLPYVRDDYLPQWCGAAQVELSFEPFEALSGGEDGLDVIRRFLQQAPRYLSPGGGILMEIGYDQGRAVAGLAAAAFPTASIAVTKDFAGLDRIVSIT